MNLADVLQELADQADTIVGLQCFAYPPDKVVPPTFYPNLPESIDFDETYQRGTDTLTLTADLLVGRANDRAAVAQLAPFVDGSGDASIKAVLEAGVYTTFHTIAVRSVEFGIFPVASISHLGGRFTIDITGSGS